MEQSMVGAEVGERGRSEDRMLASAMLLHLVVLHPERLETAELIREFGVGGGFDAGAVTATAERLREDGLLDQADGRVSATAAAIRSYELWEA
jgi:hypothetical protein